MFMTNLSIFTPFFSFLEICVSFFVFSPLKCDMSWWFISEKFSTMKTHFLQFCVIVLHQSYFLSTLSLYNTPLVFGFLRLIVLSLFSSLPYFCLALFSGIVPQILLFFMSGVIDLISKSCFWISEFLFLFSLMYLLPFYGFSFFFK